jgi:hypothetical protein
MEESTGKLMLLIKPYLLEYPSGFYYVRELTDFSYLINGMIHNKDRFVDPYPLLLELF